MKIAIVTDDGQTISRHFGRAALYSIVTVEAGAVVAREIRPKTAPTGVPLTTQSARATTTPGRPPWTSTRR